MGQTTIVLMLITILSKILGFVRESVMAAYIGAGELKSVYTTAITLPAILNNVVASGILTGFIPTYNKIVIDKSEEEANKFTSNIINILMIIGTIFLVIIFIFSRSIAKILSPNLSGDWLNLASYYTRIMILSIYSFFYSSIIKGFLNIKGNFIDPIIVNLIFNIFVIISTIISGTFNNPYILIVGTLFANIVQFIRFPRASKKQGFKYHKILDFKNRYVKHLLIMVIPIIISSAADEISLIIDNSMASAFFGISSISKIFYAKSMLKFIMGVVTSSVVTATFPEIARLGQKGDILNLRSKLGSTIILSLLLVIPATFGMMALSTPIIQLAFERSAFSHSDTLVVSSLLVSYGPYIIFASIIRIMANGFYSVSDSKTPVRIVLIQQVINVVLNGILIKIFDINGLAFATSLSTAIGSILLINEFSKKIGGFENKDIIASLIKILIISATMAFIARTIFNLLDLTLLLSLLLSVLISGIVYILLIKFAKIEEVEYMVKSIKVRFLKK